MPAVTLPLRSPRFAGWVGPIIWLERSALLLSVGALALLGIGLAFWLLFFPKIPSGLDSHCMAESSHH